jgi:nucleotide-binding universal stress UspA family protein
MKPERILIPIDVAKCPLEVFKVVNGFAERPGVTVILLHVVNLNIAAPENRVYEGLCAEAEQHLARLAREFLHPAAAILLRVRVGKPSEQILAEAREAAADLILLPIRERAAWKRLFAPKIPRIVAKIIHNAPCGVFVARLKTCFNCSKEWSWAREVAIAADFVAGITEKKNYRAFVGKELLPTHLLSL